MWNSIVSTFRKYFKFEGKADRKEFWIWASAMIAVSVTLICILTVIATVITLLFRNTDSPVLSGLFHTTITLFGLFWLFMFMPTLTVMVRRLRDAGITPWILVIPAVLNTVTFLVMCDCALANMDGNASLYSYAFAFYLLSVTAVTDIIIVYLFCLPSKSK